MNRHLSTDRISVHMEKLSAFLTIRKMSIKTTVNSSRKSARPTRDHRESGPVSRKVLEARHAILHLLSQEWGIGGRQISVFETSLV